MRLQKTERAPEEFETNMTPMIDVIFQLVLFFVFSMKFLAFEGQINAFLPRDRGISTEPVDFSKQIRQIAFFLEWDEADGGSVLLSALAPGGEGGQVDQRFPMDPGVRRTVDAFGRPRATTVTRMVSADGKKGGPVEYPYAAPDFAAVEAYLAEQKRAYEQRMGGSGAGLRLTVNFGKQVPWQMVVNAVDICTRLGITDFALGATEVEE